MMMSVPSRCTCAGTTPRGALTPARSADGLARPRAGSPRCSSRVLAAARRGALDDLARAVRVRRGRVLDHVLEVEERGVDAGAAVDDVLLAVAGPDACRCRRRRGRCRPRRRWARARPARASAHRRSLPGRRSSCRGRGWRRSCRCPAPPSCVSSPGPPAIRSLPPCRRRVVARRRRGAGRGRRRRAACRCRRRPTGGRG